MSRTYTKEELKKICLLCLEIGYRGRVCCMLLPEVEQVFESKFDEMYVEGEKIK